MSERHDVALATARALGRAAGAQRVVLLVDQGEDASAAMVEWVAGVGLTLTDGDSAHELAEDAPLPADPKAFPSLRPIPAEALAMDVHSGELAAPIGAVQALADALVAVAGAFGGRSVATAELATRDAELPLTIAGRPGEPTILAVGAQRFTLPTS